MYIFLNIASFTSSFYCHISPLLLMPIFLPLTSSHALKMSSLKCPNNFGMPSSINSITFSSNHFLIFSSFSKLTFLFSTHVFITTLLIFFLSISATTGACLCSPGNALTFCKNHQCSSCQHKVKFYLIFSQSGCILPLLYHLSDTYNFF